ncbi:Protein of unknown function [Variovorax sp. YR266]|uniref:DUF2783 domain-containing protein n=1 Tax=Variovorax sp. YR266 TaxID=1884386 RepID=UPI0008944BD4|nr:DUF2783 domain-containing protein [Variovorax sp. YR266]SDY97892.1 Protein of unknown function [Variovorax sp. YR266]
MITEPRIPDPDGFYAALLAAHEGRTDAQSADQDVLLACIRAAAEDTTTTTAP